MIKLLRMLFGLNGVTGNRTVAGSPDSIDVKELPYLSESNRRLAALQELYTRYKNTPHAHKLLAVYDKTKRIHQYLLNQKKGHALELFHLQHTDHFLNTFTAIINAYQQQPGEEATPRAVPRPKPARARKADVVGRTLVIGPFRINSREVQMVYRPDLETEEEDFTETPETPMDVTTLELPQISINTFARIVYLKEDKAGGLASSNEIGFTSTQEEKEIFLTYIADKLGIQGLVYVGNALVYLPGSDQNQPAEMVPVIHWNGATYALSLSDDRLFPVRTYRSNL
ncbi:hypothetical protein I2I11_15600 [Pontibacter sp. 172403-2]|uniref:hypothetical protein n=1 Tax=Pontibacter rufus TaxID=2791028 RepID=UPI0018AFDE91|nr:hypothetical protein [Pontibacter sp. 172403-2]MBF9254730.1 hypothetical protein [Pontibacter sp. 172403-2]